MVAQRAIIVHELVQLVRKLLKYAIVQTDFCMQLKRSVVDYRSALGRYCSNSRAGSKHAVKFFIVINFIHASCMWACLIKNSVNLKMTDVK